MSIDQRLEVRPSLPVPEALLRNEDTTFPSLTPEILRELTQIGWSRIGIMTALVDSQGQVMMLEHNGRDKNVAGALGPLGETSRQAGPIIEQPVETLYRGIQEELGVAQPGDLDLWVHEKAGWVINQWPRGKSFPGEFACAIAFPIFITDAVKERLAVTPHGNEEIGKLRGFFAPQDICNMDEVSLRPGVKNWMTQLTEAGLLDLGQDSDLIKVDFSKIYDTALHDIEL